MPFQHGRDGRVLVEDVDMSTFFNSMDISLDVDAPESTTFGAAGDRTYVSAGLRGGTVALSGFYDAAVDAVDEEISTVLGNTTNRVASLYPQGHTVGNPVYLPHSIYTSYSISQPTDGLVSITADIQPSGAITRGFSLHNLTAETATSSGTAVDLGSTGNPGGVGHLHITSSSGTTPTLTVTVDHGTSSGGAFSTYMTLVTTATGRTATRVTSATTLNRWVKTVWTIAGGTPSFTFNVGFGHTLS